MSNLTAQEWGLYIGQKVICDNKKFVIKGIKELNHICLYDEFGIAVKSEDCKPILRSLDQMTDEEKNLLSSLIEKDRHLFDCVVIVGNIISCKYDFGLCGVAHEPATIKIIDWLTQKGFAIRNEFERGIAIKEESK